MSTQHALKILPPFYRAVRDGSKTFEIRKNDRNFAPNDTILLREFSKQHGVFTGREVKARIGFVYSGSAFGLEKGFCVFSLLDVEESCEDFSSEYMSLRSQDRERFHEEPTIGEA